LARRANHQKSVQPSAQKYFALAVETEQELGLFGI
jgi:hypothetical protein